MANSLGTETPPAPEPGMGNALMSGAPSAPQGAMPQVAPGGGQAMPAPPTHAQTVAALRHFDAVKRELKIIMADPAFGKSSVKSQIIDAVMRLVAERFMKPTEAVDTLSKVPSEPLLQMKWAKGMLAQAQQAEMSILAHHAIGFAGGGPEPTPSADGHADHIAAVMGNFQGMNGGGR